MLGVMGRYKRNMAPLRYITPSVSLQYQIKKDWGRVCTCWVNWHSVVLLLAVHRVGNEHGEYLWCQRIFMLGAYNHGLLGHADFSQVFVLW